MRKRPQSSHVPAAGPTSGTSDASEADQDIKFDTAHVKGARRSGFVWLTLITVITYCSWTVYHYQYENLPPPLTAEEAGKRGFSEVEALKHVKALTDLGPHPVGSDALDHAVQYVLAASEKIKKMAHWEVDVQVDFFHVNLGANRLDSGLFVGKTLIYSDLNHIIIRILPKYEPEARENAILVSSHVDTVVSAEGAGDCSSCVAVMLELARGISQWAHGFKHGVIFLFNTGEEEGLNGAHSFITQAALRLKVDLPSLVRFSSFPKWGGASNSHLQTAFCSSNTISYLFKHPWSESIRIAVDLEAMGIGGKSGIFQAGPDPWAVENFALAAKYPSGQITSQDIFSSGALKSATDFQVYKDVAGLPGLDFAYTDMTSVYHTKNDKLELLKSGSLQHLGENMLAFLLQIASSSHLPESKAVHNDGKPEHDTAVFFDILGMYMVTYRQRFAKMLHNSVIVQSLLIWITSLLMGGYSASVSLALSCLSVVLMWLFSISFTALVAFCLPLISSAAVPYIAKPWLVVGLFGAPAFLGAVAGQHVGYLVLQKHLSSVYSKRRQLSPAIQAYVVKLEAERWLFKAGLVQWLVFLIILTYYKLGSSFIALVWLVSPAFSYGLLEATLTPVRLPRPLKLATLLISLAMPLVISSGSIIRFASIVVGMLVRFDRNPGGTPEWLGNFIVSSFIAATVCLTLVHLLSYIHLSGGKRSVIFGACILFCLSLAAVLSGTIPPFTNDTGRAVNVVHVVDATMEKSGEGPNSYISFFSLTPGKLTREIEQIKEGFVCSRDKVIDFVTFSVKYGCLTFDEVDGGWSSLEIPTLHVSSDVKGDRRTTQVSVDTKGSIRWSLAINTKEIEDFTLKVLDSTKNVEVSDALVPLGGKSSTDGWHSIQFSGGKKSPTKFDLTLFWMKNSTRQGKGNDEQQPLLKLRTDFNRITPKTERILSKLPSWCSLFGKSTSPYTLAFLSNLPVNL